MPLPARVPAVMTSRSPSRLMMHNNNIIRVVMAIPAIIRVKIATVMKSKKNNNNKNHSICNYL